MSISNYPENFIVVDTEGRDLLREIAVVDATGKLIYEAFVVDSDANKELKQKSLGEILQEFQAIAKDKIIVCHYADHDRKVIEQTYRTQNQQFSPHRWQCTIELTKKYLSSQQSYSLEYLSRHFNLKVNN